MFDTFGEFNSAEEINEAAKGQLEQGDMESLKKLAIENGIDVDMVELFAEGAIDGICDTMTAAIGKLEVEVKAEKQNKETIDSIEAMAAYLKAHCTEMDLAKQIRAKGKRISKAMEEIRKEAEKRITKKSGMVCVHIPPAEVFQMLRKYYSR